VVCYRIADGHDKAKPFVRRRRKATGLEKKTAGLPKDDVFGLRGFFNGRALFVDHGIMGGCS
jgi:hypothetical protein